MSYQVLARKWRPQNFSQLVGQEHVKTALTHALNQNRLHHAYLFTGTRGVGKTTIARIFAKSLNCEQGVTATPCGVCSACREIDQGFFVDLLEIDAASRTKVEDTRDLLDNVQYAPTRGRYKVYLIDEVHMLSRHSFNALLKTLEEPPPHVKFLLATTDPQKLPITVLSRCLQFSLKALSQQQIKQHLSYVLAQEQVAAEDDALALLARAAKGSLRDSLSLTDQAIAQTNGQIQLGAVREMLGYLEQSWAELLLQDVLNRDLSAMQAHMQQLVSSHSHFQGVLDDMLSLLHLIALSQFQLSASELALTESAFVRACAKAVSPESVQLYYQLLLSGKKDLPFAPEPRIGLEMALMRAIAFVPAKQDSASQQPARQAALLAAQLPAMQQTAVVTATSPQIQAPSQSGGQLNSTAELPAANNVHQADLPHEQNMPLAELTAMEQAQHEPSQLQAETAQAGSVSIDDAAGGTSLTASILARRLGGSAAKKSDTGLTAGSGTASSGAASAVAMPPKVQPPQPASLRASAAVAHPIGEAIKPSVQTEQPPTTAQAQPATFTQTVPTANVRLPTAIPAPDNTTQSDDSTDCPPWETRPADQIVPRQQITALPSDTVELTTAPQSTKQISAAEPSSFNAPQHDSAGAEDDEQDLIINADWQWQQLPEQSLAAASLAQASLAETGVPVPSAQPIRHALLDSLAVQETQQTDFASEVIENITPVLSDSGPLSFTGEITSENFALRSASQVDDWARRIDSLPIGGLMRLFLLSSSVRLDGNVLALTVAQSQRHLDSERNRQQLAQVLSQSFGEPLQVEVEFVSEVPDSPQALQQQIDQARRVYVQAVLQQDPLVQSLQAEFQAQWLADSLEVF